ncbi:hypothetical protein [Nocardia sp. NPDC004123]
MLMTFSEVFQLISPSWLWISEDAVAAAQRRQASRASMSVINADGRESA